MAGNDEAAKAEAAKSAGRFARLRIPAAALLLLLLGAGAGFGASSFMGGGSAEAAPSEDGGHGGGHGEEPAAEDHGGGGHGEPAASGHGAPAGGHGGGHGEAPAKPRSASDRAVVTLGIFTVNLRGNGGGRVLRTEIQVEVKADDEPAILEHKALLRDAVITLVSDYSYADLEGVDGKTHLRDELVGRLNAVLSSQPPVDRLYFTEFVVQ